MLVYHEVNVVLFQLFTSGLGTPEDLALDPISGLLYWTDYTFETINVGNVDGSFRTVLFGNNITNPRSIVLDNSPRFALYLLPSDSLSH